MIIAQTLGIFGFILSIISFQQNTHRRIVLMQLLANICFMSHYFLLGPDTYTASLLNAIGAARSLVYCFKEKKWASSNLWIVGFSILCVIVSIFTWVSPLSILPTVAMVLTTVAFGIKSPKLVRLVAFPSSPLWLIYNLINSSLGGALTEIFNMISIFIGFLRFDRKKKSE